MAQLDALITYLTYSRPGTIAILRSLEDGTKKLMFGDVCSNLLHDLQNCNSGRLSWDSLSEAMIQDEAAVNKQQNDPQIWEAIVTEIVATQKASKFFHQDWVKPRTIGLGEK